MSKKKFTDGLERFFDFSAQESEKDEFLLVVTPKEKSKRPPRRNTSKKANPGKSFTADLEALFSGGFNIPATPTKEKSTKEKKIPNKSSKSASGDKPLKGLEALLRSTIDPQPYNSVEPSDFKRVTFTFDKKKLAQLKKIAKSEKKYLKDIIGKVVSEYLEKYEKRN